MEDIGIIDICIRGQGKPNLYYVKANECGAVYREDMKVLQAQQDEIWEAVRGILERLANIS
ncbi:MAG: hypothetical protein K5900_08550 [Butyrivibrio sp.]|nr:hypothetical protein [Butyrivibrio sp.]